MAVLRTELAAFDLDNSGVLEIRPLARIAEDVQQVCRYRRAAAFHKLSDALPPLLGEVRAAVHRNHGKARDQAFELLCELYYSAHSLAHKLGYTDLAALAIDRLAWAATEADDCLWIATSQFHRAAILTSGGDWTAALAFLERCRFSVEPRLSVGRRRDLTAWAVALAVEGLDGVEALNRADALVIPPGTRDRTLADQI
ncbi:hypothetical protein [Nocardia sp. N2S4-5]|uniref:hypothetical protein n=1 Tax=Nocardia sp. N2S4-5 TaxID=3351565 RepID=UPI0037CDDA1E